MRNSFGEGDGVEGSRPGNDVAPHEILFLYLN